MAKERMTICGDGPLFVLLSGGDTAAALWTRSLAPDIFAILDVIPRWLHRAFGAEYKQYTARTPPVFPRFWRSEGGR